MGNVLTEIFRSYIMVTSALPMKDCKFKIYDIKQGENFILFHLLQITWLHLSDLIRGITQFYIAYRYWRPIVYCSCPSREFSTYRDLIIAGKGLHIQTWYSKWVFLTWNTNYDTNHHLSSIIMVHFEDPWHTHLLTSVWKWNCRYFFVTGIRISNLPHAKERFNAITSYASVFFTKIHLLYDF